MVPDASRQPVLTSVPAALASGVALVASGSGFRPAQEASDGGTNSSASNFPLLQVMSVDSGQTRWLAVSNTTSFSDTAFTSTGDALSGFPLGYARVTVFVNGIPSVAKLMNYGSGCSLDVDGFGGAQALTDGLMIERYLRNVRGSALTANAKRGSSPDSSIEAAVAYLVSANFLDVDGNGVIDAATHRVLLLRAMLGLRDDAIIVGALGTPPASGPWRNTGAQIRAYLSTTCGLP